MMAIEGTIRTRHRMPACIAASLAPDNLSSMETRAADGCVETRITGTSVRSVIASVDDYLMNLTLAEETCSTIDTEPFANGSNQEKL
ncbi:MAG: KEOPS complex subunit Pcc1 [Methanoregulaceae archaeon]